MLKTNFLHSIWSSKTEQQIETKLKCNSISNLWDTSLVCLDVYRCRCVCGQRTVLCWRNQHPHDGPWRNHHYSDREPHAQISLEADPLRGHSQRRRGNPTSKHLLKQFYFQSWRRVKVMVSCKQLNIFKTGIIQNFCKSILNTRNSKFEI